ncbi:MAG TPA: hypothetical protein IGS40_15685 [Trichormus sp. M33_DOE_039]|nr:hypothetical protein [Trichormus sp. M33_DOE_039]
MSRIQIQDLNVENFVTELEADELTEVKGGCPICILLIGAAVGLVLNLE